MAFNWFVRWISTCFSYANPEDKKQEIRTKIPISKECNGPCDSAQDNGTLAGPFRITCKRFQYNWDNGKIGTSVKINFFGKELNLLLAVCLHNFGDNAEKQAYDLKKEDEGPCDLVQDTFAHKAEKQGQDFIKEDKGSSNLCQEIFAHETEKQDHKLIKEGEGPHDLSQEKIDILKDWELTEFSDFSYLPKEKDSESEDSRKLSESTCSSESSFVFLEKDLERTYSSEDSRKCSESTDSNSSYVSKEKDCEMTYSSEDSRKLSESTCSSMSSYLPIENDRENPDSSEDSRRSGVSYRKPQIPSSDVVKIARKKKNKKRQDSSGYEGQSENSRKISPPLDFRNLPVKQNTSLDIPSKTYSNSVLKNLKPSNDPEKKDDSPYNKSHQCDEESNKDFDDHRKTPKLRPVFIDGNNIGHEYGSSLYGRKKVNKKDNKTNFSAKGLWLAYSFFRDLGYKDDQILIIQRKIPEYLLTREDLHIMDNLRDLKVLMDVGSRIPYGAGPKDLIRPGDDLLIIKLAWEHNGISKKNSLFLIFISPVFFIPATKLNIVQIVNSILNCASSLQSCQRINIENIGRLTQSFEKFSGDW